MRVAIANRGDVAVRIIRACQELGLRTILLHSSADRNTTGFRLTDEAVEIEGDSAADTYLDIEKVVAAAKMAKADLVHPGFGFLSENPDFASSVKNAGMTFVGPSAEAMQQLGHKVAAKEVAKKCGVPLLDFADFKDDKQKSSKQLAKAANKIGFPVIIKASSTGGGRALRVVENLDAFDEQLSSAQREAQSGFGESELFIEKYLKNPRHVEVQVIADHHGKVLHLGERECSLQRRHQKVVEEAPAPLLSDKLRQSLHNAAVSMAKAAGYTNAGTVEFLVDGENFYFMEMNTRLQVEHTVTEMCTGVDLVKEQLKIAMDKPLTLEQAAISLHGSAIEVRVYAEDPGQQFLPSTGTLAHLALPYGPGRRFDFGYDQGDAITPHYDPMIGKIITWAPTREDNITRMHATLEETVIFGVQTNIEFLKTLLNLSEFRAGHAHIGTINDLYVNNGWQPEPLSETQQEYADSILNNRHVSQTTTNQPSQQHSSYRSPWQSS